MKSIYGLVILSFILTTAVCAQTTQKGARVYAEITHDVSLPLRDMAKLVSPLQVKNREIENRHPKLNIRQTGNGDDAVADNMTLPPVSTTNLLSFDGQASDFGIVPPDTEGTVGATQYVQWVNVVYDVYDKTTGSLVLGPIQANALWQGFSNKACANHNDGDPIVMYDKAAQRWFFVQTTFETPYTICIAVSTSNDATGSYNRYAFPTNSSNFPDYPKWGVWPDGYYQSYNAYGSTTVSPEVCAADRVNILAGNTATIQCFAAGTQYFGLMPSDLDGNTPPPTGSPNYYVSLGNDTSHLNLWQFHVDFTNPTNSTFTGPVALSVPAYTLICADGNNFACIPQPSPGEKIDSLSGEIMYRFAYRNLGSYESLLVSHVAKPGTGSKATGAVRWYEIRSPKTPVLFQSGTIQNAAASLWMSSMAQDKNGDIAIGYSATSSTLDPSIYYSGRVPTDPVGKMEAPFQVVKGGGVQTSGGNRWGDYSAMQIDPADDCTFWFTQEYYKTTSAAGWATRINSFKFKSCN